MGRYPHVYAKMKRWELLELPLCSIKLPVRISNLDLCSLQHLSYSLLHPAYNLIAAADVKNPIRCSSLKCHYFRLSAWTTAPRAPRISEAGRRRLFIGPAAEFCRETRLKATRTGWTPGVENEAEVAPFDSYTVLTVLHTIFSVLCMSSDSFKYVRRRFKPFD